MPVRVTGSRSQAISAAATQFDKAIARFAAAYADQNQRDYDALLAAGRDGRIEIEIRNRVAAAQGSCRSRAASTS